MNILVTGAKGFVGRNLVENLKNIRDGKNRTRPGIQIDKIYEYDINIRFHRHFSYHFPDFCSCSAQKHTESKLAHPRPPGNLVV